MAADYMTDVKRYDKGAKDEQIQKIVKHLGIALQSRDASLVSCHDPKELDRVRESWCMKKLGMTDAEACDKAIEKVCKQMAEDNTKPRVTFYYLVAKQLGKLGAL